MMTDHEVDFPLGGRTRLEFDDGTEVLVTGNLEVDFLSNLVGVVHVDIYTRSAAVRQGTADLNAGVHASTYFWA